jgi:hypothetical protein
MVHFTVLPLRPWQVLATHLQPDIAMAELGTSQNIFGGGGENCTPDDLLCGQMPYCLGYAALTSKFAWKSTPGTGIAIWNTAPT